MSCEACQEAQRGRRSAFFWWGNANIELRGCQAHLREVIDALRKALAEQREKEGNGGR